MSEALVAQLQSLRDRIANDPRSAEMFEADCDVLLDAISRIKADKLRQFVKDRASSTYTDRIAALESELAQAREAITELRAMEQNTAELRHKTHNELVAARAECERLRNPTDADIERAVRAWFEDDCRFSPPVGATFIRRMRAAIDAARKEGT